VRSSWILPASQDKTTTGIQKLVVQAHLLPKIYDL
jgi:hypothetical protein